MNWYFNFFGVVYKDIIGFIKKYVNLLYIVSLMEYKFKGILCFFFFSIFREFM